MKSRALISYFCQSTGKSLQSRQGQLSWKTHYARKDACSHFQQPELTGRYITGSLPEMSNETNNTLCEQSWVPRYWQPYWKMPSGISFLKDLLLALSIKIQMACLFGLAVLLLGVYLR